MRRLVPAVLAAFALAAVFLPGTAGAAFSVGEPFALRAGTQVEALARGAEGYLWFGGSVIGSGQGNVLGRISKEGIVEEFPVPESNGTLGIGGLAPGPDGNMWFTQPAANRVGWMTTSGQTEGFQSPDAGSRPTGIVAPPGGFVWVTMEGTGRITKLDPASGRTVEYPLPAGWRPTAIALGSDASLWAIDRAGPELARQPQEGIGIHAVLPTSGDEVFTPGTTNSDIVAGPDGNLWLSQSDGPFIAKAKAIGGQIKYTRYRLPLRGGTSFISNGPHRDIYFASGGVIASFPTYGRQVAGEPLCAVEGCPRVTALAEGFDGKLWFAAGRFVGAYRPPDLRLVLPRGLARPQGKKVTVPVECRGGWAGESCTGTVSLQLAKEPTRAVSARVGFNVATPLQSKLKVPLNRAGAASLAARGKLRVRLVARIGVKVAGEREYTLRTGG